MVILSLIAVMGTTSTISHAFAEVQTSDVLGLLNKASSGVKGSNIGPIVDKAKPDFSALKSLADKFASVPVQVICLTLWVIQPLHHLLLVFNNNIHSIHLQTQTLFFSLLLL